MDEDIRNICRPIVLCNDFVPPAFKAHKNWHYMPWGYFDGIIVGDNLCTSDQTGTSYNEDLQKLCDFYQEQSKQLDGSYSTQIVYGIRTETVNQKQGITDLLFLRTKKHVKSIHLY